MKGLEIKKYGRGHQVFYKGEKCKLIGNGLSRKVYKTSDEKLVLKLESQESDYSLQSYNEYRNFLRLKKKGINYIAHTRKPVVVGKFIVVAQEYIKGNRLSKCFMTKEGKKLKERFQEVRATLYKYRVTDIHHENVIYDQVNNRLVVIDLGGGVL